jgi:primary-amine oxidase
MPNKSDVLAYIDGSAAPPVQYAHVVLDVRATVNPYFADIMVGPLPVDNKTTTWKPLTYPYTKKNGGKVRNLGADDDEALIAWLGGIGASVADITMELWGVQAVGSENDTAGVFGIDPLWQDDGKIIRWDGFWNNAQFFDSSTLLPLGLYVQSDVTGRDPSKWKVLGWLYNDIFYETTEAFRKAYFTPGFVKLAPNADGPWGATDQTGPVEPMDTMYPPTTVAPSGNRFSVDSSQNYVEWMGWSFYIGFTRDTGMALYDIRYQGQRILYELGLQEALAHYAGMHISLPLSAHVECCVVDSMKATILSSRELHILTASMASGHMLSSLCLDMTVQLIRHISTHHSTFQRRLIHTSTASVCLNSQGIIRCNAIVLEDTCP